MRVAHEAACTSVYWQTSADRCDALAVLTERPSAEKPPKNPDTREKKDVLCKVWARGDTCTTKNCPYRHAFRDAFEETWGRRLRSRRDHDLKQDEQDPFAAYDKHANRNAWRFVPGDDNRKRRHAARRQRRLVLFRGGSARYRREVPPSV